MQYVATHDIVIQTICDFDVTWHGMAQSQLDVEGIHQHPCILRHDVSRRIGESLARGEDVCAKVDLTQVF